MFSVSEIASILDGGNHVVSDPDAIIDQIRIDSRRINRNDRSLFVALPGARTDGHNFLADAWKRGARNFLVETNTDTHELSDSSIFIVESPLTALQSLACVHRAKFNIKTIGITGSNGKTWVKDWLFALLSGKYNVLKSPRSFNSQIGVPLSVLQLNPMHDLALFEAGISTTNEMQVLADIIQPEIGVFTYLGDAHDAGFESRQEKLAEKCALFDNAQTIIYPADYPDVASYIEERFSDKELISWGYADNATLKVLQFHRAAEIFVTYRWDGAEYRIDIPFRDQASWYNAMICATTLHALGYHGENIAFSMKTLTPVRMRLEVHRMPGGGILINDSYSLDLASLQVGLDSLHEYSGGLQSALIITEIDQHNPDVYQRLGTLINKSAINHLYAIGAETKVLSNVISSEIQGNFYESFESFVHDRPWERHTNTAFLLKGARRFQLERLVHSMKPNSHSAELQIDLNALLYNLKFFIGKLNPGTSVIAMVKAAAYGSGGAEVARFLEYHNVSMLGVAYTDEGVELRQSGVELPILVMNPDLHSIDQILQYNLEPEVYDLEFLNALNSAAEAQGAEVVIHIKIDTGMHRLGFELSNLDDLTRTLTGLGSIRVGSVFTHLAAATDLVEQDFTHQQLDKYKKAVDRISEAIGYTPMRHVLNTGGVLNYPEYQFDAVRLGIGLYGSGVASAESNLKPVHTFIGRISQIRDIVAGETVGYDRAYAAKRDMRIATVNIGYADGLPRIAGTNGFRLMIGDATAPIVGNICMDMCMIDISEIPEAQPGDEAIIFGPQHKIEELATLCATIPYEILTGISDRIQRVFNFGW